MPLLAFSGKKPKIHKSAYIAKSAVIIGDARARVTVGHNAILHGCIISNNVIVGMHSTVLTAEIGEYCIVGAGAVVLDGVKVPEGTLVVGVPAEEAKKLGDKERKRIEGNALAYVKLIEYYKSS